MLLKMSKFFSGRWSWDKLIKKPSKAVKIENSGNLFTRWSDQSAQISQENLILIRFKRKVSLKLRRICQQITVAVKGLNGNPS